MTRASAHMFPGQCYGFRTCSALVTHSWTIDQPQTAIPKPVFAVWKVSYEPRIKLYFLKLAVLQPIRAYPRVALRIAGTDCLQTALSKYHASVLWKQRRVAYVVPVIVGDECSVDDHIGRQALRQSCLGSWPKVRVLDVLNLPCRSAIYASERPYCGMENGSGRRPRSKM